MQANEDNGDDFNAKVIQNIQSLQVDNSSEVRLAVANVLPHTNNVWIRSLFTPNHAAYPDILGQQVFIPLEKGKKSDLRKYICPALESISNDAFEIAKILTPLLVSLHTTRIINIPLDAALIGSLAVLIARMGIATLCESYKDNEISPKPKKKKSKIK